MNAVFVAHEHIAHTECTLSPKNRERDVITEHCRTRLRRYCILCAFTGLGLIRKLGLTTADFCFDCMKARRGRPGQAPNLSATRFERRCEASASNMDDPDRQSNLSRAPGMASEHSRSRPWWLTLSESRRTLLSRDVANTRASIRVGIG